MTLVRNVLNRTALYVNGLFLLTKRSLKRVEILLHKKMENEIYLIVLMHFTQESVVIIYKDTPSRKLSN